MRNSQGSGDIIELTTPVGGIESGDVVVAGSLVVVAAHDAAEAQKFVGESQGIFLLPKVLTEVWAEGDVIYWDAVAKQATTTPGDIQLGLATAVASNSSTRGSVLLPARGSSSGGTPGGNPNQFQYNNAGAFGGVPELTRQATTPPQLVIPGGTVDPVEAGAFQAANDGFGGLLFADDSATQALLIYCTQPSANLNFGLLNGTFAAPTKAIANDQIASISFEGYTGTSMDAPASIKAYAASDGDAVPFRGSLLISVAGSATTMGVFLNGATDAVSIGTQIGASAEVVITPHVITLGDFAGGGTRPLTVSNTGVLGAVTGVSGTFTSQDGKAITVTNGIITAIT